VHWRSAGRADSPSFDRLVRRIVESVADGQKYHLRIVFSDNSTYDAARVGEPDDKTSRRRKGSGYRSEERWLHPTNRSYVAPKWNGADARATAP